MKYLNPIKAYTMLLIMLSVMIHNAYPHAHLQHDVGDGVVAVGELHRYCPHEDHHHHSGKPDNKDEHSNFLDYLFQNHSHAKHTHQYTPATVEQIKPVKQLVLKVFCTFGSSTVDLKCIEFGMNRYVLFNNLTPDHPHLLTQPLRGPPSLGESFLMEKYSNRSES